MKRTFLMSIAATALVATGFASPIDAREGSGPPQVAKNPDPGGGDAINKSGTATRPGVGVSAILPVGPHVTPAYRQLEQLTFPRVIKRTRNFAVLDPRPLTHQCRHT